VTGVGGAHDRAREAHIRRLLAEHAATVVPGDGLPRIRARIARRPWWRRVWDRLTAHTCDPREDPFDPTDVRCRICGQRPDDETAAPADTEAAVEPDGWKEPKDMTIIQRRARNVHAGDIIIRDPDPGHGGAPVRWRVDGRTLRADGVVIVYYTDVADEPTPGVAWCDALTEVAVEPVGGAA